MTSIKQTPEYRAIKSLYGDTKASRSDVPLINHIDQGLAIIEAVDKHRIIPVKFDVEIAQRGFCLHPIFQSDVNLAKYGPEAASKSHPLAVLMAMEYRQRANFWLSDMVVSVSETKISQIERPVLSGLPEVNAMLIADKVQNRKDFVKYHKATHARSAELAHYFVEWLEAMGLNSQQYLLLKEVAIGVENVAVP